MYGSNLFRYKVLIQSMTPEQQAQITAAGFDIMWVKQWFDCDHSFVEGNILVSYSDKPIYENAQFCTKCNINKKYFDQVQQCLTN